MLIGSHRLAAMLVIAMPLAADAIDNSWNNLKTAVEDRYASSTVMLRDRTCISGHVGGFDSNSLTVGRYGTANAPDAQTVTVQRTSILRVTLGGGEPTDMAYSGRNSWDDVRAVAAAARERLRIELRSGKAITGAPVTASESQLTLHRFGKDVIVEKADIAQAYFVHRVRKTPSREAAYVFEEASILAPFFPQTWPYVFDVGASLTVRLYDSSMAEDTTSVGCRSAR